ncbi:MAG: lipopolysaccharide heptosyltransferase II [Bacteroidota bacterium]
MKILVAQTVFLGDLVLTIPLLQHLRHACPDAQIDVLVAKGMERLLASHPAVSSVLTYDKSGKEGGWLGVWRLVQELRKRQYSLAFVLPGSIRTALAIYLAHISRRIGTDQSSGILLFAERVKFPQELKSSPHARPVLLAERIWRASGGRGSFVSPLFTDVVSLNPEFENIRRHLQLLSPLGIQIEETLLQPKLFPSSADQKRVDEFLSNEASGNLIAVALGSVWATKRWPLDHFRSLVDELIGGGCRVVVIGGREDAELSERLAQHFPSDRVVNACGRFTPLQSSEMLRRCRVLVTNDSAPMHLAAAVGTPCVAIFGPTVPEFGFAPFGPQHIVIERKALWCRPCTPHGGARCPIGTHECMTGISANEVCQAVFRILERPVS